MATADYPSEFLERHLDVGAGPSESGGRSDFERDRDRILYSSAFRALGAKTQVVASTELGFLHNRLTHSLKVAQVGKALANRLSAAGAGVDPVLVETACLAHDIGHPPFGHAGEVALDLSIEERRRAAWESDNVARQEAGKEPIPKPEVWDGFEGNAQNLRVLTRLATHKAWEQPGLHLTRATLLATTKYPWTRSPAIKGGRKWGAYAGDMDALAWMLEHSPLREDGLPEEMFEKRLMDWADDVTYAVHDVDDWYRLGIIPLHDLFKFSLAYDNPAASDDATPELRRFVRWVEEKWGRQGRSLDRDDLIRRLHLLSDRVHVTEPFTGTRHSKGATEATVSDLISYFVDEVEFTGAGLLYDGEVVVGEDQRLLCDLLQELVWFYVIEGVGLASQQHGQQRIIAKLVQWIHEDHGRLLPRDRQEEVDVHGDLTRAIADHVASLTEPMAVSIFGKLSGNALGAVTDNI